MKTTVHHLQPEDLVSWTHNGVDYQATLTNLGFAHIRLYSDRLVFLRNEDYDGRTVFTVHNRVSEMT